MKKLQLFIIISSVLLASYAFPADFLITDDFNNFCVDFDYSRQSELWAAKRSSSDKPFIISDIFGRPYISSDVGIADIQSDSADTDIDIPEESKICAHGVTLMSSTLEGALLLTVRCPAAELFRFPSEAYRLRI
jgi:hypothetical protein